jgi:RimJ/RimL family protein N-acetyltransferase
MEKTSSSPKIKLRDIRPEDLPIFFDQQSDPEANQMAAFTRKDPTDWEAFDAHWAKIMANENILIQTIEFQGQVAGSVLKYDLFGLPEISYWLGKEFWGQGIATQALKAFLEILTVRPVYAHAAADNQASIRVLEKCGFKLKRRSSFFANARGEEIEEVEMVLG